MDSRAVTNYLKGLAILCVMELHYSGIYAQSVIPSDINLYSAQVVYFFFALSGFGIYYSLERRFRGGFTLRSVSAFYFRRAVRIYPLYWLAMLAVPFVLERPHTWELSKHNLGLWLGLPWLRADSWFWFISALIQCYLLAPFLYLLLKKMKLWWFLFATFLATDFLIFFSVYYATHEVTLPLLPRMDAFIFFDNLFFENIILFALGLAMPAMITAYRPMLKKTAAIGLPLTLALIVLSFYLSINRDVLFANSRSYYALITVVSIPLFASYMIALGSPRVMPLRRVIGLIGVCSFSVYLFHPQFYGLLDHLHITRAGHLTVTGVSLTIALLPLFVFACYWLERGLGAGIDRLILLIARVRKLAPDGPGSSLLPEAGED